MSESESQQKIDMSEGSTFETGISTAEYQSRIDKIQKHLVSKDLGALVAFSTSRSHIWYQTGHVSYLSNWADCDRICDSMVVVPKEGDPVMLLSGLPYMVTRAQETSWIKDIRIVAALDPSAPAPPRLTNTFGQEVRTVLKEQNLFGKKIGVVGLENMPVPVYKSLLDVFPESEMDYSDDIVAELRSYKSPAEVAIMRKAAQLSDLGFETMLNTAKDGMMGYEVIAEMEGKVRSQGADYAKFWMCSGPAEGWSVTILDLRPHARILNTGDQITCCSYVVYNGYWAHSMRTGFLGKPSPQQERIFPPCADAHKVALETIKPGVRISDVVKTVRKVVEKGGMKLHCSRIGHGIGLDYGEKPTIHEDSTIVLQPGHVIEVHAQCDLPGTESFYVPLGDVLHVTKDGIESLTTFPRELFQVHV